MSLVIWTFRLSKHLTRDQCREIESLPSLEAAQEYLAEHLSTHYAKLFDWDNTLHVFKKHTNALPRKCKMTVKLSQPDKKA